MLKLLTPHADSYATSSGALFIWLAVRTAAQTVLFVLVARSLGAEGYGSLIAVTAVAAFFSPLAGLGGQTLLLREGARDPNDIPSHFGNAIRLWLISVIPLFLVAYFLCTSLFSFTLSAGAIAAVLFADLVGGSLLDLLSRVWHAQQKMQAYGGVTAGLIGARLGAFFLLVLIAAPTPEAWAMLYGLASIAYVTLIAFRVFRVLGRPIFKPASTLALSKKGLPFAFIAAAMRIHAEANKPILAQLEGVISVGLFGAAQRISDLALLPAQAMVATLAPRVYREKALGLRDIFRLGAPSLVAALLCGCVIFAAAPILPLILNESYDSAVAIVRMLAFLPCFAVVRMLISNLIISADGQRFFYRIHPPCVTAGLLMTIAFTSNFGIAGAVIGMYITDVLFISIQCIVATKILKYR